MTPPLANGSTAAAAGHERRAGALRAAPEDGAGESADASRNAAAEDAGPDHVLEQRGEPVDEPVDVAIAAASVPCRGCE